MTVGDFEFGELVVGNFCGHLRPIDPDFVKTNEFFANTTKRAGPQSSTPAKFNTAEDVFECIHTSTCRSNRFVGLPRGSQLVVKFRKCTRTKSLAAARSRLMELASCRTKQCQFREVTTWETRLEGSMARQWCGDVPRCDDPPPGPMAERSMARQGVETFRIATILLPVPWLQILQCQIQEVTIWKIELREFDIWIVESPFC
jgi:hypothetical protein